MLLLEDLQGPEQRAPADSEHGGQFTYRLALLVETQKSFLLGHTEFIGLVAASPRATRASRDAARRSLPSSSSSSAIVAMMLVTARPVGVLASTPSRGDRTWTPRLVTSSRTVAPPRTDRPSRSTATTTRWSPL